MAEGLNYDWKEFAERGPYERFPEWAVGYHVWREFAQRLNSPRDFDRFLEAIAREREQARPKGAAPNGVTRIFVSHKQENREEALRVAWLVQNAGHHYWLDILEPALQSGPLDAILIAGIIEMALLNCTHVIALITPESVRSRWIPYEYGRAKEPTPYALNAACWLHPKVAPPIPEYLYLGVGTRDEMGINAWLARTPAKGSGSWSGDVPVELPSV
jgi:hypothetical protein